MDDKAMTVQAPFSGVDYRLDDKDLALERTDFAERLLVPAINFALRHAAEKGVVLDRLELRRTADPTRFSLEFFPAD